MTPIGTMAHEFMQAFQALDVRHHYWFRKKPRSNLGILHEYRGDLGLHWLMWSLDAFYVILICTLPSFDGLRMIAVTPIYGDRAIMRIIEN
jgi:nicotinate phosphoribosyltransferase